MTFDFEIWTFFYGLEDFVLLCWTLCCFVAVSNWKLQFSSLVKLRIQSKCFPHLLPIAEIFWYHFWNTPASSKLTVSVYMLLCSLQNCQSENIYHPVIHLKLLDRQISHCLWWLSSPQICTTLWKCQWYFSPASLKECSWFCVLKSFYPFLTNSTAYEYNAATTKQTEFQSLFDSRSAETCSHLIQQM